MKVRIRHSRHSASKPILPRTSRLKPKTRKQLGAGADLTELILEETTGLGTARKVVRVTKDVYTIATGKELLPSHVRRGERTS